MPKLEIGYTKRCGATWRTCSRREFQALAASGRTSASASTPLSIARPQTDDELADVLFDTLGIVLVCFKHSGLAGGSWQRTARYADVRGRHTRNCAGENRWCEVRDEDLFALLPSCPERD